MKKELILSLGTLIGGCILSGFAWTTTLGNPAATICIVGGLAFSVGGFISFVLILKKRINKKE